MILIIECYWGKFGCPHSIYRGGQCHSAFSQRNYCRNSMTTLDLHCLWRKQTHLLTHITLFLVPTQVFVLHSLWWSDWDGLKVTQQKMLPVLLHEASVGHSAGLGMSAWEPEVSRIVLLASAATVWAQGVKKSNESTVVIWRMTDVLHVKSRINFIPFEFYYFLFQGLHENGRSRWQKDWLHC